MTYSQHLAVICVLRKVGLLYVFCQTFPTTGQQQKTFWKSDKFDNDLVAVRGVTDAGKRKQMYHDLQEDINMNGGSITPAHLNYTDGAASYVKGLTFCPLNNFGGAESPPYLWRSDA